nr:MAG TPA: hypothetical protein [Caudoviricetes sp.]
MKAKLQNGCCGRATTPSHWDASSSPRKARRR